MGDHLVERTIRRFAALISILPLVAVCASSQVGRTAFDYYSNLEYPHRVDLVGRGDMDGDAIQDLISAGGDRLTVSIQGETSFDWKHRTVRMNTVPSALATGRLNGDRRDDLAVYSTDPAAVDVYFSSPTGVPRHKTSIDLSQEFQHLILADIDGDRSLDILLYGKKSLGITVLRGDGRGRYDDEKIILPEQSFSHLSVLFLDDDDIPDLLTVNWIRNRVEVYSGFGAMNFSDPATMQFDQEPLTLAAVDLNGDRIRDILVGFGESPSYSVFTGSPSGAFTFSSKDTLRTEPSKVRIGDPNGDGLNDILVFSGDAGIIGVGFQDSAGAFQQIQHYDVGGEALDAIFFRDRRDRSVNCAVRYADRRGLRILHTLTPDSPDRSEYSLSTGKNPEDLLLADVNGDGWTDAVVSHGPERVMNIFLNNGRGPLLGLFSISVPQPVERLLPVWGVPQSREISGVGRDPGSIYCTFLRANDLKIDAVRIPGDISGVVIATEQPQGPGTRRIYVLRGGDTVERGSVFAYDIVGSRPSDERELTPAYTEGVMAFPGHDFNNDGLLDLVTLSDTDSVGWFLIRSYIQDSLGFTPRPPTGFSAPEIPAGQYALWSHDLNDDGYPDLLINFQRPSNTLYIAFAQGDTGFASPELKIEDIRTNNRKHLLVATDFDIDGKTDLVLLNERTNTIQFFPGNGKGDFDRPVNLSSGSGVTALGVADLDKDGENELIVSVKERGGLSVTTFHHPLYRSSASNDGN